MEPFKRALGALSENTYSAVASRPGISGHKGTIALRTLEANIALDIWN